MGYKYQFPHTPYILRAKVTQAGPFPPTIAILAHLWYAYCIIICNAMLVVCLQQRYIIIVARSTIAYSPSAVVWYCGIVVLWYHGIVVYYGGSCLRLRCVCGAPAVPLLCAYGVVVVYSATAVDWL